MISKDSFILLYKIRKIQYKTGTVVQYHCAVYLSEIAFAIESVFHFYLSTFK